MSGYVYLAILRTQLRIDEGVRRFPYKDSVGKLTIGIGRNLTDVGLSENEITFLLENDIVEAERTARSLVRNFDELTDGRKAVVCNMAFNMGHSVLSHFKVTLKAINDGRWADAARGMRNSLWAKQVGDRAERLAKIMEGSA